MYRVIDFKRDRRGVPAKDQAIEYDPYRAARIALLQFPDGERRYIIAPEGLKVGTSVTAGPDAEIQIGNALPLKNIPVSTFINTVEMTPGKGGQIGRSAGNSLQLMA